MVLFVGVPFAVPDPLVIRGKQAVGDEDVRTGRMTLAVRRLAAPRRWERCRADGPGRGEPTPWCRRRTGPADHDVSVVRQRPSWPAAGGAVVGGDSSVGQSEPLVRSVGGRGRLERCRGCRRGEGHLLRGSWPADVVLHELERADLPEGSGRHLGPQGSTAEGGRLWPDGGSEVDPDERPRAAACGPLRPGAGLAGQPGPGRWTSTRPRAFARPLRDSGGRPTRSRSGRQARQSLSVEPSVEERAEIGAGAGAGRTRRRRRC